ncbi:A24 family peptidase [Nocardioides sp. YIM 152315]|uniref:prepilin peptidase n=1 Tax=Nocardioides sp. YIM 152315 TaxID=3031760 RepID=UPI0023DA5A96|nr:A24 family peptidase [Nocardioides sp. YIM 152315]MDF1603484.1 prepilin peptidase [Nocardioides sp. YIM 152315]
MTSAYLTSLGLLGLVVGSFLNVVIHRVPAGLSVVSPGSACPACAHAVRPIDNVPVVSWLLLRGRCRDCAAPIAVRYPLVEATTGALFVVAGWRFGATPYAAAVLVVVAAGVALAMIDLDHRRLPFPVTGAMAVGTVVALAIDVAFHGTGPVPVALLSLLLWLGVYGGVWLATRGRGMGLGDVALAPVLGLALGWHGWGASLVGLAAGFVVGALVGGVLLAGGVARRGTAVPHGPFLLSGALLGLIAGQPLASAYLRLVGLG